LLNRASLLDAAFGGTHRLIRQSLLSTKSLPGARATLRAGWADLASALSKSSNFIAAAIRSPLLGFGEW
jgi:hypothetical protein